MFATRSKFTLPTPQGSPIVFPAAVSLPFSCTASNYASIRDLSMEHYEPLTLELENYSAPWDNGGAGQTFPIQLKNGMDGERIDTRSMISSTPNFFTSESTSPWSANFSCWDCEAQATAGTETTSSNTSSPDVSLRCCDSFVAYEDQQNRSCILPKLDNSSSSSDTSEGSYLDAFSDLRLSANSDTQCEKEANIVAEGLFNHSPLDCGADESRGVYGMIPNLTDLSCDSSETKVFFNYSDEVDPVVQPSLDSNEHGRVQHSSWWPATDENLADYKLQQSETASHLELLSRSELSEMIHPLTTSPSGWSEEYRAACGPSMPQPRTVKDEFLVRSKLAGMPYKEIRERGGFSEAESTLRGRFRALTKDKHDRVRKPTWRVNDVRLLKKAIKDLSAHGDPSEPYHPKDPRVSWKKVAEYIAENGGSYHFGNATCKKKWIEIQGT